MVTTEAWRWAQTLAQRLLGPLGDRWVHVRAVGERAQWVAPALPNLFAIDMIAAH